MFSTGLKAKTKTYTIGFGLILAGALGNFIDRIALGYVRDFIMFDFWKSFPIFNFADCLITVGAFVLMIYLIVDIIKDSKNSKPANENEFLKEEMVAENETD